MALLNDFLAGLNFPPVTLLKHYLENGIPEDLQSSTQCAPTDWCLKSSSKSSELRARGNEAYRSRKYDEALKYYSQSIASAPTDSIDLAFGYGNRSAILLHQMEYELCLLDTNRALDGPLPQSSRTELLERKTKCWKKLQEQNVMRTKLRAGLSNLKCKKQERTNLITCERQLCYISKVDIDDTDLVIDRSLIDETTLENEISGNLSPKVQQRVDEETGQAFIAAEDIEPGELLSNDDFYALIVQEFHQQQFCDYCSVWCKALIPCPSCSQAMYCCVGCREKAYDTYHETECKLLPLWGNMLVADREARRLVLRIFLTGTKQGSDLTNLLNDPQVYAALNGKLDHANAQYSSTDYPPILNTFWKLEDMKEQRIVSELLEMFISLRCVKFFGATGETKTQCSGNTLTNEELMAVVLLAHSYSLCLTQFYQMIVHFWESDRGKPMKVRIFQIGIAIGPWHSFLNHSCDPNITIVASGRRAICRSVRPIKAGQQIYRNICMHHALDPRKRRQDRLRPLFGRECSCVACVGDWPLFSDLLLCGDNLPFENRKVMGKLNRMRRWLFRKINGSIAEDDLQNVLGLCKIIRQYMSQPAYPIVLCETFIRLVMTTRGNFYFTHQKYITSLYDYL